MQCIMLLSVACLAEPYFFTLSHKQFDFQGKTAVELKTCALQLLSETFHSLRRIQQDIIINVHRSSCKVPWLFLSDFRKLEFLIDFVKILKFHENLSSGGCVVQCGRLNGQT